MIVLLTEALYSRLRAAQQQSESTCCFTRSHALSHTHTHTHTHTERERERERERESERESERERKATSAGSKA
jgi:hypothetical protein